MRLRNFFLDGLFLLTLSWGFNSVNCANILGLFTSTSQSHLILYMSVATTLAEAGHNITVLSTRKPTKTHPSIRHIIVPATEKQQKKFHASMSNIANMGNSVFAITYHLVSTLRIAADVQFHAVEHENFKALYDEKFDLVILGYFMNDFMIKVAAKFKCPIIVYWMIASARFVDDFVGNPSEMAYVSSMNVFMKSGEAPSFWLRAENVVSESCAIFYHAIQHYHMRNYYGRLFPNEEGYPTFEEMRKNVSLLFYNSHFSEGLVRPNVPAVVEIGGTHLKDKPSPLPKDIADFVDSSLDKGFILFSLGSNLQGSHINRQTVQIIFKTLASLEQKVIWKWDDLENVPGKSPNILYIKWLPQEDVLAHPKIKLFITHAGKGGILEAQTHAVPMLALPVFADQPGNAAKMAASGYGIQLDLQGLTENDFRNGVLEVLNNPKYKENIRKFAELYRDRPMTAKKSVVYWTEYVMRHHGARHMQSPLVHLNFIQSRNLDVIGAAIIFIYILFKVFQLICKVILEKFKSRNVTAPGKKHKTV